MPDHEMTAADALQDFANRLYRMARQDIEHRSQHPPDSADYIRFDAAARVRLNDAERAMDRAMELRRRD